MTRTGCSQLASQVLAAPRRRPLLALALAAAVLGAAAGAARAATGFTYRLVKDFPATSSATGPEEVLCNFAFNPRGQAAYSTLRIDGAVPPGTLITSVYFWDGAGETLVERIAIPNDGTGFPDASWCPSYGIGLNDAGLISLHAQARPGVFAKLFLQPGAGLVGVIEDPHQQPLFWSRGNLNEDGLLAYFEFVSPASGGAPCLELGAVGLGVPPGLTLASCAPGDLAVPWIGGAIVTARARAALLVRRGTTTSLLDFDTPARTRITDLGPVDAWHATSATPGFNRWGRASLATDGPSPGHAGSAFRVALVDPARQLVAVLADAAVFTEEAGSVQPTWLNDLDQVLVGVQDVDPGQAPARVARQSLWLIDSDRQPLAAFLTTEPLELGGATVEAPLLAGPASFAPGGGTDLMVNDQGEVMFSAVYAPAGAAPGEVRLGIFIAQPEPGLTPGNPSMPEPIFLPIGWRFSNPCEGWRGRTFQPPGGTTPVPGSLRPCYVDPAVATGYTFTAEPGSAPFASVRVPAPLPGGDAEFAVEVGGQSFPLRAGETFDLAAVSTGGASRFRITGIDLAEALSPVDPAAFVVGLTWVGAPPVPNSFTMVPIADTDDDGVEDAADVCPGTALGAPVDARGCSAAQRDTDGDGVSDAADACPGTALGTPVDVTGCPIVQPARACDVDRDGDVDRLDLKAVAQGVGKRATGPADPRDPNRDGRIDLRDVVLCTLRCSRLFCASP